MADDELVNQNDIEKLLAQSAGGGPVARPSSGDEPSAGPTPGAAPASKTEASGGQLDQAEIEAMLSGGASSTGAASTPQPDDDKLLAQDEIERLLSHAGAGGTKTPPVKNEASVAVQSPGSSPAGTATGVMAQQDLDYLFDQAQRAIQSIDSPASSESIPGVEPFRLEQFTGAPASTESATLDLIRDVDLDVQIELGRTHMYLEEVLRLRRGSVVPLDKLAGDPVDIYVNGRLIARGEVLVLNDNFCVRVAELISGVGA